MTRVLLLEQHRIDADCERLALAYATQGEPRDTEKSPPPTVLERLGHARAEHDLEVLRQYAARRCNYHQDCDAADAEQQTQRGCNAPHCTDPDCHDGTCGRGQCWGPTGDEEREQEEPCPPMLRDGGYR